MSNTNVSSGVFRRLIVRASSRRINPLACSKPFNVSAPDSASQPETLLQAFPKLISPILLLLFPCRAASFSPQVPFCLLFIRHLFLKQQQSFLPVRRMNFSLFSLKKIRKKQKLSLTICSCIITRIRMFCLTRPRISITNYSVLWIMLHVS